MMRRFAFAWAWFIAAVLAVPSVAQVAPIELGHGEQVTISCAPAPPACPSTCGDATCDPGEDSCSCPMDCGTPPAVETGLCADGIDNDCDGSTDCGDMDCFEDQSCAPPPSGSPPQTGLERHWRWDNAHAVTCGVSPVETVCMGCVPPPGTCIHHLLDNAPNGSPQEATEVDPLWWPEVDVDGARLTREDDDQLLFLTCTSLDPLVCTEEVWSASSTDPWSLAYVGTLSGAAAIVGNAAVDHNLSIMDITAGGWIRIRMDASGRVTLSTNPTPFDTPLGLVVEYDGAAGLRLWRRLPCGAWQDITTGAPVNSRAIKLGCWSCYYPNGWLNGAGVEEPHYPGMGLFREGLIYRGVAPETTRSGLFAYLDAEHGAWIDGSCQ